MKIMLVTDASDIVTRHFDEHKPDKVHIATEGSLGLAMRQYRQKNSIN